MGTTYTLKISRSDLCRLMCACTAIEFQMKDEMRDSASAEMWARIHDVIETQIDEQDKKQPWYKEA